ncbi:MAG TPA: arginase family protein [Chitinophagaceae bacterium]
MKNPVIIELPTNLGLKEPSPGKEPGVKKLPAWLKKHGFHSLLQPVKTITLEPPAYSMNLDNESQVRNADKIVAYAEKQLQVLKMSLLNGEFPVVIGGDCSVLIGNSVALKEIGTYGLFFLDGHTDFMWPSLSQTGGAAGMDLAIVTGYGHDKLTDIHGQKPYFKEEHVWCVGNREYEEWYVNTIRESSIHYIDLDSLRQTGIKKCVTDFIKMVDANNLDGYWIHIDVDVLNDDIMPAVDSRQPDGLNYPEFNELMKYLLSDPKATGLEITILDPDLDSSGLYTKEFVANFCETFNAIR